MATQTNEQNRTFHWANALLSVDPAKRIASAIVLSAGVFGVGWTVAQVLGVSGGIPTLIVLLLLAVIAPSAVIASARMLRWPLLHAAIRSELDWFVLKRPRMIFGIGPGGAMIAGMIAKEIARRTGHEPTVIIIDRIFKHTGRELRVRIGELGQMEMTVHNPNEAALLVASEVHTGNTIRLASRKLDDAGVPHSTFAVICSPTSTYAVDRFVIQSDVRELLPWPDNPIREATHQTPAVRGRRLVIAFDFDGVIANSMLLHENSWRSAAAEVLGEDDSHIIDQLLRNLHDGKAGEEMFQGLDLHTNVRQKLRRTKDLLWDKHAQSLSPMPGAVEAIFRLAKVAELAVASTANRKLIETFLGRIGVESCFKIIVTNKDVQNPKPAADMLEKIANYFGIEADEVIMVGDTDADRTLASEAGCRFIPFGNRWEDTEKASDWAELEARLERFASFFSIPCRSEVRLAL